MNRNLTRQDSARVPDERVDRAIGAAALAIAREAESVAALGGRLDAEFRGALLAILECRSRVVVTGLGKSGHIAGKLAATLASTGTPSFFVHATESLHGDSGMVTSDDVLIAISASGETADVTRFVGMIARRGIPVVCITADPESTLGRLADWTLDCSVTREADPLEVAPTSSTTTALAMGDAMAAALMVMRSFTRESFRAFHPEGARRPQLLG